MKRNYDDIIGYPHPTSLVHPRMSLLNRAAQFAPFAALTGFDEAILETARPTEEKLELSEAAQSVIDACLQEIAERIRIREEPRVTVTYFLPDESKEGGMYATVNTRVRRIDSSAGIITLGDGTELPVGDLYSIELISGEDT